MLFLLLLLILRRNVKCEDFPFFFTSTKRTELTQLPDATSSPERLPSLLVTASWLWRIILGFEPTETEKYYCVNNKHFFYRSLGLDPASVYFITDRKEFRLDESDARYVDVIHSNAGVLGTTLASGHTDFWPNGEILQPGCLKPGKHLKSRDNYHIFAISYRPR